MDDSLDSFLDSRHSSILEDKLHDFRINLEIGLMMAIPTMKTLATKSNNLIDNLHDIFSIISTFPITNIEPMISEKLKLITRPIVYFRYFRLDSFGRTVATVLWIFVHYVIEDLGGLKVDELHQLDPVF